MLAILMMFRLQTEVILDYVEYSIVPFPGVVAGLHHGVVKCVISLKL
jgi:hypothetical protein